MNAKNTQNEISYTVYGNDETGWTIRESNADLRGEIIRECVASFEDGMATLREMCAGRVVDVMDGSEGENDTQYFRVDVRDMTEDELYRI